MSVERLENGKYRVIGGDERYDFQTTAQEAAVHVLDHFDEAADVSHCLTALASLLDGHSPSKHLHTTDIKGLSLLCKVLGDRLKGSRMECYDEFKVLELFSTDARQSMNNDSMGASM